MKTLILFNTIEDETIQYRLMEGDYKHLHTIFIGLAKDKFKQKELHNLRYNEDWTIRPEWKPIDGNSPFPEHDCVIHTGFVP